MKNIVEKLITKSFKRLLDKGLHRGFITYEELAKSLGKRHYSQENIESACLHIFDNKICLVEKKSQYRAIKKKDSDSSDSDKSTDLDKSDDPIRMYLREMGGVELLSREGEIAIAKRIEAGKDIMLNALMQSPLAAQKIFEWKKKLESNELLVREIIDIDSSYMDIEVEGESSVSGKSKINEKKEIKEKNQLDKLQKKSKETKETNEAKDENYIVEDEFNPSLAAMEEEVRPKIISTIDILCKNYNKLIKYQNEKLNCALNAKELSRSKESGCKKNTK